MGYHGSSPSAGGGIEVGAIQPFRFSPSSEWLELDGSTYNVDDYPVLGALYGGTPGGTFTVDDYSGRAIYAADGANHSGTLTGTDSVDISHTHTMPHTHQVNPPSTTSTQTGSQPVGILGILSAGTPANETVDVDIPEFTSGASSTSSTGSSLSTIDKRPARGYVGLYIKAL